MDEGGFEVGIEILDVLELAAGAGGLRGDEGGSERFGGLVAGAGAGAG